MRSLIALVERAIPASGSVNTKWIPFERRGRWRTSLRATNGRVVGFVLHGFEEGSERAILQVNADNVIVGDKSFDRESYDAIGRVVLSALIEATRNRIKEVRVVAADAALSRMLKTLLVRARPSFEKAGYTSSEAGIGVIR